MVRKVAMPDIVQKTSRAHFQQPHQKTRSATSTPLLTNQNKNQDGIRMILAQERLAQERGPMPK